MAQKRRLRRYISHILVQNSYVAQRVQGEKQHNTLIGELKHRVRNSFASMESIIEQTFRSPPSVEEARVSNSLLIVALSRAHHDLNRQHWVSADLGGIMKASVKLLFERALRRIGIAGSKVKSRI